jgi:pimeloyl-ACP methyl ester carboxylesterase
MFRRIAIAILLGSSAGAALAQAILRTIPDDAKLGVMSPVVAMTVEIDGQRFDLAAGAQIRDGRNMIVLPNALPPNMVVRYQLDPDGKVRRVWMLSPQEAALLPPTQQAGQPYQQPVLTTTTPAAQPVPKKQEAPPPVPKK